MFQTEYHAMDCDGKHTRVTLCSHHMEMRKKMESKKLGVVVDVKRPNTEPKRYYVRQFEEGVLYESECVLQGYGGFLAMRQGESIVYFDARGNTTSVSIRTGLQDTGSYVMCDPGTEITVKQVKVVQANVN